MKKLLFAAFILIVFSSSILAQITSTSTSFKDIEDLESPAITTWWDITGDNDFDVVIGSQYDGKPWLKAFKNDQTNLWSYNGTTSGKVHWLDFEDMDNDNDLDLAVAAGCSVWVFKDAGGNLNSTPNWSISSTNATYVEWGNYNGDSYVDLAIAANGYVKIYNNSSSGLSSTPNWSWTVTGGTVHSLSFGTIRLGENADKKQSLSIGIKGTSEGGDVVYVFEHNGTSMPSSPTWSKTGASVGIFGKFDDDDADDLFINYSASTTDARVYLADEDEISTTYYNATHNVVTGGFSGNNLLVSDLNTDGYNDLAMKLRDDSSPYYDFSDAVIIYYNDGGEGFSSTYTYFGFSDQPSPVPATFYFGNLSSEDIDNDGDYELVNGFYGKEWNIGVTPPLLVWEGIEVKYFENQGNADPLAPKNLALTGVPGGNPTLSWDANSERDLDHYEIWRYRHLYDTDYSLLTSSVTTKSYTDTQITIASSGQPGGAVYYKIKAVDDASNASDFSGAVNTAEPGQSPKSKDKITRELTLIPSILSLHENYPNPFNPRTTISFSLPDTKPVKLNIYNVTGQKVKTLVSKTLDAGTYDVEWNGTNMNGAKVSSGIYIYELVAGETRIVKKMLFSK